MRCLHAFYKWPFSQRLRLGLRINARPTKDICDYSPTEKNCCFGQKIYKMRRKSMCFPLRTVASRGHGFSLLEKPTLRGLQTRAIPAGVNGHPLQTTIIIVKASYTKHHVSEGNTRRLLEKENRFFCVRCIS